jgi:hypothetical protein
MAGKKKKLTHKQRALVKNVAKGMSQGAAAKAAGYTNRPYQAGHQALEQIAKSGAGADLLDRFGLTDDVLVNKYLKPLLEAHETKFFAKDGIVVSCFDVIDLNTRIRALDIAFRIKGSYKAEQENVAGVVKCLIIDRSHRPPRPAAIDIPTLKEADAGSSDQ